MYDKILYDVQSESIVWWPELAVPMGLFIIAVCVVLAVTTFNWLGLSNSKKRILWLVVALAFVSGSLSVSSDFTTLRRIKEAASAGKYEQTEGVISQYQEERRRTAQVGGSWEYFIVNGQRFVVKGEPRVVGYRTTIKEGSPLSTGAKVRVRFVIHNDQAIIVHLEMI